MLCSNFSRSKFWMIDTLFNHCCRHHNEPSDDDDGEMLFVVCYRIRPERKIVFQSVVVVLTHTQEQSLFKIDSRSILSHTSAATSVLLAAFFFFCLFFFSFQSISLCVFSWEMWFGSSSGGGFRSLLITKRYTIGERGCCWQRVFITHKHAQFHRLLLLLLFLSRNSLNSSLESSLRNSSVMPSSLNGSWLMLN